MYYFYYDQNTGEFTFRSSKAYEFTSDPYILQPQGFNMANHRVDLSTLQPIEKT